MSRAGPSSLYPAPTAARSRSLRNILWLGLALCLVLSGGGFAAVVHRVVSLGEVRADLRTRYIRALEASDRRLFAVLDGDDHAAVAAAVELAGTLDAGDRAALADDLRRLEDAASPDDARAAHAEVRAHLHARLDAQYAVLSRSIDRTVLAGVVLFVAVCIVGIVMVRWLLRRTAAPLERLSTLATNTEPFPQPESSGVREVDALAWALHELDLAVRDREERLAAAHAEAVELSRFGEHVQQLVDETELHDVLAQRLLAVSDAHAMTTLLRSEAGRLQVAKSTRDQKVQLPILAEPAKCRAIRSLKPVSGDGGTPTACRCPLAPEGKAYLCEPMVASGELVGVVNLQADWKGHFTSLLQARVHASLGFGATAIASLRLLAATRERAFRDPLTGAHNRAFLEEFLDKQLALADRRSAGLGILALDLDHFKRLNDTHGHAAGDRALIAVVETIQREVRTSDAVVRHGGEEIIVVLVDTDLPGATDAAERIRAAIEAIEIAVDGRAVPVRASIGVAAFPDHGRDQRTLLGAADRALYRAKDAGRNQVFAPTSIPN